MDTSNDDVRNADIEKKLHNITALLQTLVKQTRYQYITQYTRHYRIDTTTGKWKELELTLEADD